MCRETHIFGRSTKGKHRDIYQCINLISDLNFTIWVWIDPPPSSFQPFIWWPQIRWLSLSYQHKFHAIHHPQCGLQLLPPNWHHIQVYRCMRCQLPVSGHELCNRNIYIYIYSSLPYKNKWKRFVKNTINQMKWSMAHRKKKPRVETKPKTSTRLTTHSQPVFFLWGPFHIFNSSMQPLHVDSESYASLPLLSIPLFFSLSL